MSSDQAMRKWLAANEVMGRMYAGLGKPVVLEEWSWHSGRGADFGRPDMGERTLDDLTRYGDAMMDSSRHAFAGWMWWMHRDMPRDEDLTQASGLFTADGEAKPWAHRYGQWADRLKVEPPTLAPAVRDAELPMLDLFTDDRAHEDWWMREIQRHLDQGPAHYVHKFPPKPMTDFPSDVRPLLDAP